MFALEMSLPIDEQIEEDDFFLEETNIDENDFDIMQSNSNVVSKKSKGFFSKKSKKTTAPVQQQAKVIKTNVTQITIFMRKWVKLRMQF